MPFRLFKNRVAATALGAALFTSLTPAKAEPALWQIKNGETAVYLFGSIHVLPPDLKWRSPRIDKAITSADVLVFEAAGSERQMDRATRFVRDHGTLPRGQTLSRKLSPEGLKDYKEVLKKTAGEPDLINVSQPWRALYMLETSGFYLKGGDSGEQIAGLSWFNGVDLKLEQEGDKKKIPKRYFETGDGQMAFFAEALPDNNIADFERHLSKMLKEKSMIKALIDNWSQGNVAFIAKQNAEDEREFPHEKQTILNKRNQNWIPQIEGMLTEKKKTFFITVGAAHLAGSGSVIELLCAKGWKVQRVNDSASPVPACAAVKPQTMAQEAAFRPKGK